MFCSLTLHSLSQDIEKTEAIQLVSQNLVSLGISKEDLGNSVISSAYYNKTSETQLVYLQQTYKGLPIFNQIQTLAFKNGKIVSAAGSRLTSLNKSGATTADPLVAAATAARTALAEKQLSTGSPLAGTNLNGTQKLDFGKLDVTREKLTAELMWVPLNDGKVVKLVWQVYLVPQNSSDYWLINIDAKNNAVVNEINLTVYCNFDGDKTHKHQTGCEIDKPVSVTAGDDPQSKLAVFEPLIINGATYRVVPYPAESPLHGGGNPDLKTNPWTLAPNNATSLKWHSDGTNDWTYTRGNNVWSYHDRNNNNAGDPSRSAQSTTTTDPLSFDFVPDFTIAPTQTTPVANQQFNITNLFYWNNIIHDLVYQYGFNEPAGNFQANNQGRGGAGNDHVKAEAQDGGGSNNANFSTPADGGSGVMQMYLWNNGSPQKDGDVDNGIIVHEFGHGISNRLAGGPASSGCVSNAEQMGEGWSDYYALMSTQDWANTALSDGFNRPRGIGTYVMGQTPAGVGIRTQRYSTNFAVNNKVYATTIPGAGSQHVRGELWCATLWDMTWNIINQVGSINPNIFDASVMGGNSISLKLVTEGLKLQVCNSGFIDGRDGILRADQLLYNGAYRCAIMQAFARRGMGFDAQQGSANSTTDQTPGFSTVESSLALTQNVVQQLENLNIIYNNRVTAGACSGLTNYLLTDTLPLNVTYVSGGSYNITTRVVSFPVNVAAGQTQNYSFTVKINNGTWFPTVTFIDERVTATTIPSSWITSSTNTTNFVVSSAQSTSAPNSFFAVNEAAISDFSIATVEPVSLGAVPPVLSFLHNYNTEAGWDGGVVELSTNNGSTWDDLGAGMTENGYNGSMGTGSNNPIGGRAAFTGNSNGFVRTSVSLAAYANLNARFRFRTASDDNTAVTGWYIDDILLQSKPLVRVRSNLFNASGVRVQVRDTVTLILESPACMPAAIATHPANTSACAGGTATFTVAATGSTLSYQWQVSTDAGIIYSNIVGANSATLTLNTLTTGMNNNRYRVIASNACPSTITSTGGILSISDAATVTSHPQNTSTCAGGTASFTVAASGTSLTYQWQVSTNGGTAYSNIPGAMAATYNLTGATAAMNNYVYRAVVFSCGPTGTNSNAATLTITSQANITTAPASVTVCPGESASFIVVVNGTSLTYQWQNSTDGGITFNNIPGATGATLTLTGVGITSNDSRYRVVINGTCTVNLASTAAVLNVNTPVAITRQPANVAGCTGSTVSFNVNAAGTSLTYQWQVSINGGAFSNLTNNATYAGVTSAILSISNLNGSLNGHAYRVVVTGTPCGAVTSAAGRLTANSLPGVTLAAAEYNRLTPSVPSSLYSTVSPAGTFTYQWFKEGILLPGITGSSYPVNIDRFGNYFVTATDVKGCSASSNLVTIRDSISSRLFVYPNPGSGQFQVRYYSANTSTIGRTLNIYDARGSRVYSKAYSIGNSYERMDVNLINMQAGVYMVELKDAQGKRLASGMVVIQ